MNIDELLAGRRIAPSIRSGLDDALRRLCDDDHSVVDRCIGALEHVQHGTTRALGSEAVVILLRGQAAK